MAEPSETLPATTESDAESLEAARFAITHFATWVTNADTKAGLLVAATTLLGGIAGGQRARVLAALEAGTARNWVSSLLFGSVVVALIVTAAFLVRALIPRIGPGEPSRYGWPHVARAQPADLAVRTRHADRCEAWATAVLLAGVARRKYEAIRRAMWFWLVAATAFMAWVALAP